MCSQGSGPRPDRYGTSRRGTGLLAPSIQLWLPHDLWVGAGAGVAFSEILGGDRAHDVMGTRSKRGVGLVLRAGISLAQAFMVSIEVAFFDDATLPGLTVQAGYQFR